MFDKKIFRDKALERLSSPEEFDTPLRILNIKAWLLLLLLLAIMASVFLWAGFSNMNQEINCKGMILKEENLTDVLAIRTGFVENIMVNSADSVMKGELLFHLYSAGDKEKITGLENAFTAAGVFNKFQIPEEIRTRSEIRSPITGSVFEISITNGSFVNIGDRLMKIEHKIAKGKAEELEVIGFIPGSMISIIEEDFPVMISPANVDVKDYGYLIGRVKRIAAYPVSEERVEMLTRRNPGLQPAANEKIYEVVVIPERSGSGLKWSSNKNPDIRLTNGTLCELKIISRSKDLFSFISSK
jgi:multidrug efflux pump subunit AcrA (membrane-fusion protein)